jgi:hypothetical protein
MSGDCVHYDDMPECTHGNVFVVPEEDRARGRRKMALERLLLASQVTSRLDDARVRASDAAAADATAAAAAANAALAERCAGNPVAAATLPALATEFLVLHARSQMRLFAVGRASLSDAVAEAGAGCGALAFRDETPFAVAVHAFTLRWMLDDRAEAAGHREREEVFFPWARIDIDGRILQQKLPLVLRLLLETVYAALGCQRVIFCLRDASGGRLVWRAGVDNVVDRRAWQESPYQFSHVYLYPMTARTWRLSLQTDL